MSELELAWAAGLFDGEGHISSTRSTARPKHVKLYMHVSMCDEASVNRFCEAVGVGHVTELKRKTVMNKTVWRWQLQSTDKVKKALDAIWPYLGEIKKADATRALERRAEYDATDKFARTKCKNGHGFPENRREWPNGKGYCIRCLESRKKVHG